MRLIEIPQISCGVPILNRMMIGKSVRGGLLVGLTIALYGCGRGTDSSPAQSGTQAQQSDIAIVSSQPGITPFIASVQFIGQSVPQVASVEFNISPKLNSVSQPVNVNWSATALATRGYLQNYLINLPVFGLYQGYQNQVTFQLTFNDGSTQQLQYEITAASYTDPTGVYLNPTIVKARAPGSTLGFNFFIMKSSLESPVIVDTDGQLRWAVPFAPAGTFSYFADGQFVAGSQVPSLVELQ